MTAPAREAERLGELLKAATPGPWLLRTNRHTSTNGESWGWISPDTKQNDNLPGLRIEWNGDNRGKPNAALIVAAVNALPGLLAERAALVEARTQAASDVLAERARQIAVEGWTPAHDDEHDGGELARAGAAYALMATQEHKASRVPGWWPWSLDCWKPKSRREDLVRAGALILAEIERLDRALVGGQADGK